MRCENAHLSALVFKTCCLNSNEMFPKNKAANQTYLLAEK